MIILDGKTLTLKSLKRIARHHEKVAIDEASKTLVDEASAFVAQAAESKTPIYGINTGFGELANVSIDNGNVSELQMNLLKSHACGVGAPLSKDIVRAMLALRVNALVKGYSGIRLDTLDKMVELINKDVIPVVFEKGSLGASGDLALLSHMSLPLVGLGEVWVEGVRMPTPAGFKQTGIQPLERLHAKEGLSLINGTQAMTAIGGLVLADAFDVLDAANLAAAMSLEALTGIIDAFHPDIHEIRNHPGQIHVAKVIRTHLEGSRLLTKQGEKRVQDAYSLRCIPQVHGASLEAFQHAKDIIEREMNAVTDNPIILINQQRAISAGNFHGQPLALAFDYLGIALAELANISERRLERMVNPHLSNGLPPFLIKVCGLNSGFMIVQYSAASLVSENKVLAHPASVDSIPSSAGQEDHVSMGAIAARKAKAILENTRQVVAMEMMTAAQAIDFRGKEKLGKDTSRAYHLIRKHIPFIASDEVMQPHLHKMDALLADQAFIDALSHPDKE